MKYVFVFLNFCGLAQYMVFRFKKRLCKFKSIETLEIIFSFTKTDPTDWHMEFFMNRKDNTAFCRSV